MTKQTVTNSNSNRLVEGHGYFRTLKGVGLVCAVVIAGALATGQASADQVTPSTSAVSAVSAISEGTTPSVSTSTATTADTTVNAQPTVEKEPVAPLATEPAKTLEEVASTPNTVEATNQKDLDTGYTTLKNQADILKVNTKEEEAKTYDSLKEASKDLNKQSEDVVKAAKVRDDLNAKLDSTIKDAEKAGITVKLTDDVIYDKAEDATADVNEQVTKLTTLTETVTDAKSRLEKVIQEANKNGIVFKDTATLTLVVGKEDEFKAQLVAAEKAVQDAINAQKRTSADFDKAVKEAQNAKVTVVIKGQKNVSVADADKALATARDVLAKAVAEKEANDKAYADALKAWEKIVADGNAKVESEYKTALDAFNKRVATANAENDKIKAENAKIAEDNKNAKATLAEGSTAKASNGQFTQSLKGVADVKVSSTGEVSITPEDGVSIVSAQLVSPSGKKQELKVEGGKVSYKGSLTENGQYSVDYTFAATANKDSKVTGIFKVSNSSQDTTTSTRTTQAPMDLIAMVDSSPSFSSRSSQIFPIMKEILKDAHPQTRLAFFDTSVNTTMSHIISNDGATRWMSLDDAKKFVNLVIDHMKKTKAEGWSYYDANNMFYDVLKQHPEYLIDRAYVEKPIEKAHEDLANKNKIFNVLQVTDGWSQNEEMDSSFAEYVKAHAKTFVSAIDASGAGDFTIGKMRALGFDTAIEANPVTDKDKIANYFREVATETIATPGEVKIDTKTDTKVDTLKATSAKAEKPLVAVPTDKPVKGTFKAPAKPVAKENPSVTLESLVITTKTPKLDKVTTEAHKVGVSTTIHPVTYKAPEMPAKTPEAPTSVSTQTSAPAKAEGAKVESGHVLPNTGSEEATGFGFAGIVSLALGLVGISLRRKAD